MLFRSSNSTSEIVLKLRLAAQRSATKMSRYILWPPSGWRPGASCQLIELDISGITNDTQSQPQTLMW